jgi:mannose-6-phosphate isomerase-like protein (cupin superfamily)
VEHKVSIADLPEVVGVKGVVPGRRLLEGCRFGLKHLTLVLGETPPGGSIRLHRHEYEEVFIIHAGRGLYTVGDMTVEAGAGDVVIVPAGMVHGFSNPSPEPLVHTAVHSDGRFVFDVAVGTEASPDAP